MKEHESDIKRKFNLIHELFACESVHETEEQLSTDACRAENEKVKSLDQDYSEFLSEKYSLR